jgi:plasmid stabilization system protein ParE
VPEFKFRRAVVAAIKDDIATLTLFPRIGSATDDPAVLIKIARPYHYLIFYSIAGNAVLIRRVRHPARQQKANEQS